MIPKTWSFPNLGGHYITTADNNGERISPYVAYDPWGAEYPGATTINNASGNADLGAYGSHGKLEEHATTKPLVLTAARPFSPTHGRFLSVDPVEGGCANAYVYVYGDPVNTSDLTGKSWWNPFSWTACGVAKVPGNASRALVLAGLVASIGMLAGVGATAVMALGVPGTAASAVQMGAGLAAGDEEAYQNGLIGATLGLLTLPPEPATRAVVDGSA